MSILTTEQVAALEDSWQALTPVLVNDDQYISLALLHGAVGKVLFPNGIADNEQYDLVVETATALAHKHGFVGETQLRPPQVAFDQIGSYLPYMPPLPPDVVSLETLGDPYRDATKPVAYYAVQTVQRKIAQAQHGKSHLAADAQVLLEQRIDAAMAAKGWVRTTGARPRYEKTLVPKLDGLHGTLVRWLETQQQAVYHTELIRRATTHAFDRAYDVSVTTSAEYKQLFQPILDALPDALRSAKFETTATNGVYQPQPLEISAEIAPQLYTALNSLETIPSKHGDLLSHHEIWLAVAEVFGMRRTQFTSTQIRQVETSLLNHWLQRSRYRRKSRWVRGQDLTPRRREGIEAYFPICQVVRDTNHRISLGNGKEKAFPVHAPLCIIDGKGNQIVCLQLIGNPQAVKANWARLMSAYQTPVEIDGIYIRQRGMKQHLVFKRPLPLEQVEWVLLHKQASFETMQPDEPFYVLDNEAGDHPAAFFPMLDAALAVPLQAHWTSYLWQQGLSRKLIQPASDRAYGKMAWRIDPATETWEQIIQDGFQSGELVLLHEGQPVQVSDALELISTYTTDQAIEDGFLYDVEDIEAVFKEAGLEELFADVPALIVPAETAFPLGRIVTTPGALELAEQGVNLSDSLCRHANADWGEMKPEDLRANDHALKHNNARLFSSYDHTIKTDSGEQVVKLWIITEWDHSRTTLLEPSAY